MILQRYPDATFEVGLGPDPEYLYLTAVVDTDDGDVFDLIAERLVEMDVEEDLPILVMPVRPAERLSVLPTAPGPSASDECGED